MKILPRVTRLSSRISDVIPLAGGGLAALTSDGIVVLDAELQITETMAGTHRATSLVALDDGRFVAFDDTAWSAIHVATRGGALVETAPPEKVWHGVSATPRGYLVQVDNALVFDTGGERRVVEIEGGILRRRVALGEHVAVAGFGHVTVVDLDGTVRARRELPVSELPIALAAGLAVPAPDAVEIVDATLATLAVLPIAIGSGDTLQAFADGLLCTTNLVASYWELSTNTQPAWTFTRGVTLKAPVVVGRRVVIAAWDAATVWIVDEIGGVIAELALAQPVDTACAFGDGIALHVENSPEIMWWREGHALVALAHDVLASIARPVPWGLVTAEHDVLYAWHADGRTNAPVAAPPVPPNAAPLDTPISVADQVVTLRARGRFATRAVDTVGKLVRVEHGAKWRPLISRDDARALVTDVISRRAAIEDLGRPLAEVAHALGVTSRVVASSIRARRWPLLPPRALPGYDYLGSFTSSGALTASDPAYLGKRMAASGPLSLMERVTGREGEWHVFARSATGRAADRTAELVVIHKDGFDSYASDFIGHIGVESGRAGVFDRAYPKAEPDGAFYEGPSLGRGAIASSGYGNGTYSLYGATLAGVIIKLRLAFLAVGPTSIDATMEAPPPSETVRRYAASASFEIGEHLEHVKFGRGTVIRVLTGNKIEVAFPDERRVLVHAKK